MTTPIAHAALPHSPQSFSEADHAEFVRQATVHREPRLANARFFVRGPNTMTCDESIYVFACPPVEGLCRLLAVSVPDAAVWAMDWDGLRRVYEQRDAAYANGGPWWMKPIGRAPNL